MALLVSTTPSLAHAGFSSAHSVPTTVLRGNGLATLRLGSGHSSAIDTFDRLYGRPTTHVVTIPELRNCGAEAQSSWHSLGAFFNHHRLVGLACGPGRTPSVRTDAGLRLGDILARARFLYPKL